MEKLINGAENCIKRLKEISEKNKEKGEYSLVDILLKDRFEKQLIYYYGYTKDEVKKFSPTFYNN